MLVFSVGLFVSYLLAYGTINVVTKKLLLFSNVKGLRRASICLISAPIALAWVYAWLLRLLPEYSSVFYLIVIMAFVLPLGLFEAWRILRLVANWANQFPGNTSISRMLLLLASVIVIGGGVYVVIYTNLKTPLYANDPLGYFSVARKIFEYQQLIGVYPLIDDKISAGFYSPWTHPPGFVMMIVWAFGIQGGADLAGVAKLTNVFYMGSLLLLVFSWSGGNIRYRGLVAALLVLLMPVLLTQVFDSHVDLARVSLWTASFCLLSFWFRAPSLRNTVGLGVLVGLSMFVHSIGLVFWAIYVGLFILIRGLPFAKRIALSIVLFLVSLLMVAPDYWQNMVNFGYVVGDRIPLWEISEFKIEEFLNEQRHILTLRDKFGRGIFDQIMNVGTYGYSTVVALVSGTLFTGVLLYSTRLRPLRIFRHLTTPNLTNMLLLSSLGFAGIIILSILFDTNLIVKNYRYLSTMTAIHAILSVTLTDLIFRYFCITSERKGRAFPKVAYEAIIRGFVGATGILARTIKRIVGVIGELVGAVKEIVLQLTIKMSKYPRAVQWYSGNVVKNWIFLSVAAVLVVTAIGKIQYQVNLRETRFPVSVLTHKPTADDKILICSRVPQFQIIGEINEKLSVNLALNSVKILTFRPSDAAYYGKFPFISYIDPKLIPVYSARSANAAFDKLKSMGVSHILLPRYRMGEIENTAIQELIDNQNFVREEFTRGGYRLLSLAGVPSVFQPVSVPLNVSTGKPIIFDATLYRLFDGDAQGFLSLVCNGHIRQFDIGDDPILSVTGKLRIQLSRRIEVNSKNTYRLSFDMRVSGNGAAATILAGLATYDASGKLETSSPGTHRYGVANGKKIPVGDDWVHMSGLFQGVGNENYNQFRQHTKYVSPLLFLNYQNAETKTEIRRLKFELVLD